MSNSHAVTSPSSASGRATTSFPCMRVSLTRSKVLRSASVVKDVVVVGHVVGEGGGGRKTKADDGGDDCGTTAVDRGDSHNESEGEQQMVQRKKIQCAVCSTIVETR
ncbi:hypothetical protein JHK84_057255 [Glycine max]|nr:hypothetical protein JHK86_057195 [Glycine max]KAG4911358.1 hypothetical protein JHK87_057474 [Glycine soja]KAG5076024.1 hypothetical protein JHK84_057255 [Glycine max]KAH1037813.1 hypothetical protein GYH30_056913 [Glycine max]